MIPRARATLLLATAAITAASGLTACGNDRETSLAIQDVRRRGDGLVIVVECARITSTSNRPQAHGPNIVEVRGFPKVGRCRTEIPDALPVRATKIIDATTGEVVDLPPRP